MNGIALSRLLLCLQLLTQPSPLPWLRGRISLSHLCAEALRSPLQLAISSTINLQWKGEARLQGVPGDRLPISGSATQREENGTEEPQAACTGQLGPGSGKLHLCSAAPKQINL